MSDHAAVVRRVVERDVWPGSDFREHEPGRTTALAALAALEQELAEARTACEKAIRERRSLEIKEDDWHAAYEHSEARVTLYISEVEVAVARAEAAESRVRELEAVVDDQRGFCVAADEDSRAAEAQVAEAVEGFRLVAEAAGADGTDPDAWRAMTFPSPAVCALQAVRELREQADDGTDLRAEARVKELELASVRKMVMNQRDTIRAADADVARLREALGEILGLSENNNELSSHHRFDEIHSVARDALADGQEDA